MPLQHTAEFATVQDPAIKPPETEMILRVPGLNQIPLGVYSLGVPILRGRVQIGMRGTPDAFDRLAVGVTEDAIEITRRSCDLQIETGVIDTRDGKRVVGRTDVLVEPIPVLTLRKDDGQWIADRTNVLSCVGLTRFVAKVGEAAIAKKRKFQLVQEQTSQV